MLKLLQIFYTNLNFVSFEGFISKLYLIAIAQFSRQISMTNLMRSERSGDGGGVMGSKSQAKTRAKETLSAKEAAQRMTWGADNFFGSFGSVISSSDSSKLILGWKLGFFCVLRSFISSLNFPTLYFELVRFIKTYIEFVRTKTSFTVTEDLHFLLV